MEFHFKRSKKSQAEPSSTRKNLYKNLINLPDAQGEIRSKTRDEEKLILTRKV